MKLSEVLEVLLKAEDEALEIRDSSEQEVKSIIQKAHENFARDQEARLSSAREKARSQVESNKQSVEMEALHISDLAKKARDKMQQNFDAKVPGAIAALADDMAAKYASQGRF